MSNTFQFRDQWPNIAPEWLTTGTAERYMYTLQFCSDLLIDKCNQAIKFRMPGQGDTSQLPYLANDRMLVQGPGETNASFVARLTAAFSSWKLSGSRSGVLQQLKAYMQNLQPGVAASLPAMTIVGGCYPNVTTWDTAYVGDDVFAPPTHTKSTPANFNWDGKSQTWRAWLVLYMSSVATGLSGVSGSNASTSNGSFVNPGSNVGGVWVPAVSGIATNTPFMTLTNLSGLTPSVVGMWIAITNSARTANNGFFQIVQYISSSSCVIANPNAAVPDLNAITWSISSYPFIAPGPAWGSPGYTFGQGQTESPPLDFGSNIGGVWQPTAISGGQPTISWGLSCSANTIESIRLLLQRWKSAGTYYPDIIVCFDGGTGGTAGNAYSPASTPGNGNPDGTFGGRGHNVSGVWTPTRLINYTSDCYCQGTGTWINCSVPNVT
jgi:hypothetical protein